MVCLLYWLWHYGLIMYRFALESELVASSFVSLMYSYLGWLRDGSRSHIDRISGDVTCMLCPTHSCCLLLAVVVDRGIELVLGIGDQALLDDKIFSILVHTFGAKLYFKKAKGFILSIPDRWRWSSIAGSWFLLRISAIVIVYRGSLKFGKNDKTHHILV